MKILKFIDYSKCIGCGECVAVCQFNAAQFIWNESADTANEKIAEYAYAVIKDKASFHINFIINVSIDCDCFNSNDLAIVSDIGIAASFDPFSLIPLSLIRSISYKVIQGLGHVKAFSYIV